VSRIWTSISKQEDTGLGWGRIKQIMAQLSLYVAVLNLFMLAPTAYHTTLKQWFVIKGYEIPFWMFMVGILILLLIISLIEHKYSIPSFFKHWNEQFYSHGNQLRSDIEEQNKKLDLIMKELKIAYRDEAEDKGLLGKQDM